MRSLQQRRSGGVQEFSGSVQTRPNLVREFLSFAALNIHTIKVERILARTSLQTHARARSAGGFTLARVSATEACYKELRGPAEIARDGRQQFAFWLSLCGASEVSQLGRSQRVIPGSYALMSTAEPFIHDHCHNERVDAISFLMPNEFVNQRVVIGERFCLRRGPRGCGTNLEEFVCGTVRLFESSAWQLSDDEFLKSARLLADLVLLAQTNSVDALSSEPSVRAANLARAKHVIRKRLSNPDLTLADIAHETGVSLNYLHKLFRDEGRTMYEYLKSERLQCARELLEASPHEVTITDIAFECGFSDKSYFSRSFKQAFGISPSDVLRRH